MAFLLKTAAWLIGNTVVLVLSAGWAGLIGVVIFIGLLLAALSSTMGGPNSMHILNIVLDGVLIGIIGVFCLAVVLDVIHLRKTLADRSEKRRATKRPS